MIEDKEAYQARRDEILDRQNELFDRMEYVDSMLEEYGDLTLGQIREKLDAELDKLEDEYQAHTREEFDTLAKISKEFSAPQVENWIAQGYDTVDLVNAYLRGDLDKFRGK